MTNTNNTIEPTLYTEKSIPLYFKATEKLESLSFILKEYSDTPLLHKYNLALELLVNNEKIIYANGDLSHVVDDEWTPDDSMDSMNGFDLNSVYKPLESKWDQAKVIAVLRKWKRF